ncbi:MAG: N-acetylmuramoyl-L-alanine amidase [Chthoniobacter sp.]|jgi:N-acetylmuramoyl-L-alanine amidase|nr:N-acetylmuramoyl-L-alanine amidase [Chthoniobacter sp.]
MRRAFTILLAFLVLVAESEAKTKRSRHRSPASRKTASPPKVSIPQGRFSTVVIDPGHGGHDLGGIPQNIIPEKGATLDVARRLSTALQATGFCTVLTREDDTFVSLPARVAAANAHPEGIFVSIHFNSGLRPGARGIETFYSSASGAALASRIQRHLLCTTTGDNRGIKRAGFFVLRKSKIRSVLAECGFLTNREDVALAQSASYRQRLAEQIAEAIVEYRDSL